MVCNDLSESRINRLQNVMNQFFYDYTEKLGKGEIKISQQDARTIDAPGHFNKVIYGII